MTQQDGPFSQEFFQATALHPSRSMHQVGAIVEARGRQWIVAGHETYDACAVVTLEGCGDHAGQRLRLIEPFDRLRPVTRSRPQRASRQRVLRVARVAVAATRPADGLWAAASARITLLPFQLEPALAVLSGSTRVLLADAVGLGKTIQAGLILSELRARGLATRALVLTPAGLRHAWASELRDRFGLAAAVVDQSSIAAESWIAAADVNPWTCHDLIVASIDFVKRPDVLPLVEAAPFDVVIADEAHHLTPGSDRGAAADRLAKRSAWVVLVSATPHSGDETAFGFLRALGAQKDPIEIFWRSRSDVGIPQSRRSRLFAVRPTQVEAALFDAVDGYAKAICRERGQHEPAAQLLATTLRRRAASSALALSRTLARRRDLLSGASPAVDLQPSLPWEDVDSSDGDAPDEAVGAAGLNDAAEEQLVLERLIVLSRSAVAVSSKIARLLRLVARVREPVVVFTEYRDTLEALAPAFGSIGHVDVIHGALPIDARRLAVDRFDAGASDVLLATDAAGEGLNLQKRCRLVINIDLPWNPLRLEQRIGRVDRIGQTRRVHAVHLFHAGTVEDTVRARLESRRSAAQSALVEVHDATRPTSQRAARAAAEVIRLDQQRRWSGETPARRPLVARPRPGLTSIFVWLVETRMSAENGASLDHRIDALSATLDAETLTNDWRRAAGMFVGNASVTNRLRALDAERRREVERVLRPLCTSVLERLERIRAQLDRAKRRQWQASLFDRRAERRETQRVDAVAAVERHVSRRVRLLTGSTVALDEPRRRLIAAFALGPAQRSAPRSRS